MKALSVVGARPNFMKVAPLHRALGAAGAASRIVHTGQHYDERMSDVFFRQLELPHPHHYLGVGSGSHAVQTARIMEAFEPVLAEEAPDVVVVVGDVNSTVACGLVAAKAGVPVAHVEAGLRSRDRSMPEEINRVLTDHLSDALFASERSGVENLAAEGVDAARVHFVGNVMIDSLVRYREQARAADVPAALGVEPGRYVLMTMHRPGNVDVPEKLAEIVRLVELLAAERPVVFPAHPRVAARLDAAGLRGRLDALDRLTFAEPMGYVEFLGAMAGAGAVVTDSGGIQEETTFLGVPCLTVRPNTERPVTITEGTNELAELDADAIAARVAEVGAGERPAPSAPEKWDGRAAERIASALLALYGPA